MSGEVPEGWSKAPLLQHVTIVSGQVDPREEPYCDMPLVAPNHIESGTGRLLAVESGSAQGAISGKYLFQKRDVIYSKIRPYLRKVWLADRVGMCSADMYPMRGDAFIDQGFLFALLLSDDFTVFAEGVSARTGIPKINREELATYDVLLPPLPEQKKIAAILSSVDEAIQATQAVIDQTRRVKEGLLQDLLTRGLPGHHTRFKQTEIGEIPESWEVRRIESIGEVQLGRQKAPKYMAGDNPRPYLRVVNVTDDGLDLRDVAVMDFDQQEFLTYHLRGGDVLITEGDLVSAWNVGRTAVYRDEIENCCFTNTLIRFRPHDPRDSDFCNVSFTGMRARGVFARLSSGSTVQHLGGTRLKSVSVPWPPKDERAAINQVVSAAERTVLVALGALNQMQSLKTGLLQDLLTGKVRVTP